MDVKDDKQPVFGCCVEGHRNITTEEISVALGAEEVSSRLLIITLLNYITN